jgi:kinetochore protein Spc25
LALHGQYEQLSGRLGCSIEGVGPDTILVLFTSVDPKNRAREFSFVLDFSTDVYRGPCFLCSISSYPSHPALAVLSSDPVLPGMGALLEEANTTGDLWPFFVRVRIAFATMVNGN